MRTSIKIAAALCLVLACQVFPAAGDPLTITPHVSVKHEYTDNVLFSAGNEKYDHITTLSGGLEAKQDAERLDAALRGQFDKLFYREHDSLDDYNYRFNGNLNYQVTERLGTRASARYAKDTRRDEDTDTTGLLLPGDRKSFDFSMGSNYLVSELDQADLSLSFKTSDIDDIDSTEDNDSIGIDFSYHRNLSSWMENTIGIFNLNLLRYKADTESRFYAGLLETRSFQEYDSDIFQFSTGLSHDITELYNLFCLVGASYTRSTEHPSSRIIYRPTGGLIRENPGTEVDSDTFGGVLSAGVNYKDQYYNINLTLSQDMRGGTGTSGAVQRSSVSGSLTRKITSDFSLTLSASCYLNKNDRKTTDDVEELTINVQPGFRYKLARDFYLSGVYRFTSLEDREDGTSTERSLVYLMLKKDFEL